MGFVKKNQFWYKICWPCSKLMEGWMKTYKCEINENTIEWFPNTNFTPQDYMVHVRSKSCNSYHHYMIEQYLTKLYCTDEGILRPCIADSVPRSESDSTAIINFVSRIDIIGYICSNMITLVSKSVSSTSSSGTSSSNYHFVSDTIVVTKSTMLI